MTTEKRKNPRISYRQSALIVGNGVHKVYTSDLSDDGVGLTIKDGEIRLREYIRIFMLNDVTQKMFTLSGTVMHVEGQHCGISLAKPDKENSAMYQGLLMYAKILESRQPKIEGLIK